MQPTLDLEKIKEIVQLAIKEDIGKGDITARIFIPESSESEGIFITKEDGIIAGLPVAKYVFSQIDNSLLFSSNIEDGSKINKDTILAKVKGSALSILSAERLALNFLQRLSGIATHTNEFVQKVKGYKTQIMDTRKTTPGWRYLEKYAVRVGGGVNHRMGLYDQILIKDNHLKIIEEDQKKKRSENLFKENGLIHKLVEKARKQTGNGMLIEVEVEDLSHIKNMLDTGVDIIMFDNMESSKISEAVNMVREFERAQNARNGKAVLTEASGNISIENVEEYAKTGVDRISVGTITHSARALDISMDII
ncbi:MAG: nicotinate-nucleotide pyrophosphorylase [Candidatus Scalindua rubra]|uniref:Probable nicotinate-nucleotide pyrophosphorylase [carboxylating] n=1 Tax=Candidatus Scalindua rubra TaxID=1872076 RepID=A0A1E3X5C3_9BACT|nr:MAG: nicotinate-nucleotide pyrophosphorylase [Candidatus Scalindua rubra]